MDGGDEDTELKEDEGVIVGVVDRSEFKLKESSIACSEYLVSFGELLGGVFFD